MTFDYKQENTNSNGKEMKKLNRKTIGIYSHPNFKGEVINITSKNAFHFSIGSILGDGGIHKKRRTLNIEQRSARFAMWKRGIAIDTGLIANHTIKGNYKKKSYVSQWPNCYKPSTNMER